MKKAVIMFVCVLSVLSVILFIGCTQSGNGAVSDQPTSLTGSETLEVIVLGAANLPLNNLEVDLWKKETTSGPPNAGYTTTDGNGKAVFKVPAGEYRVGFNLMNFPQRYEDPLGVFVTVNEGITNTKTIQLNDKKNTTAACTENWTCGVWEPCKNGTQTKICTDISNCGTTNNMPQTNQSC